MRPKTADELHQLYLAKGAFATTAIEGNTLSEEQVRAHMAHELHLPPSKQYLAKEIDNALNAYPLAWPDLGIAEAILRAILAHLYLV